MRTRLFIACCLAVASLRAEDLTLRDGSVLKNATVTEVTPAYISVRHDVGVAHVLLQELPADLQKKYGYDPVKAAKYSAADAAARQQIAQDIAQQEAAKRAAEQQDYQSAPPPDPKDAMNAQLQQVQNQRHALEDELDRVHDAQKDAGPVNKVQHTKRHTAWGHIKSITTSPNAFALAQRESELRQQIEDLKQQEKSLRQQLE